MKIRTHDELALALLKTYAVCAPLIYLPLGGASVAMVDILGPAVLVYLSLRALSRMHYLFVIFALYAVVAVLSVIVTPLPTAGPLELLLAFRLLFIALPFWLATSLDGLSQRDIRGVYAALLVGAGLGVAAGLALHFLGINIREEQQTIRVGRLMTDAIYRAGGVVGGASAYGQITAIFGVLLFMAGRVGLRLHPALIAVSWLMVGVAFVTSSSRGGMAMLLTALVVIALLKPRMLFGLFGGLAVSGVAVVTLVTLAGSPEQQQFLWFSLSRLDVLNLTGESRFTESVRFEAWARIWAVIFDVPPLGFGYKLAQDHFGVVIDNSFMFAWLETGLVGFILFVLFWVLVAWRFFVDYIAFRSPLSQTALGLCAGFIVIMNTFGAHTTWSGTPLVFLMLGLAVREGALLRQTARSRRRASPAGRRRGGDGAFPAPAR